MKSTKVTLSLLTGLCVCLTSVSAYGGLVDVVVQDKTAELPLCAEGGSDNVPEPLAVCNVLIEFSEPADRLLSVGFSDISTDDPNGFFQHPLGADAAPLDQFIGLFHGQTLMHVPHPEPC